MLVKHSTRTVRRPCRKCGRKDLYWAHDTDITDNLSDDEKSCGQCGETGKFTLIEKNGERHTHAKDKSPMPWESDPKPGPKPTPPRILKVDHEPKYNPFDLTPKEGADMTTTDSAKGAVMTDDAPKAAPVSASHSDDVQAALELLAGALGPKIDTDEIRKIVKREVSSIVYPTKVVVERVNGETKEVPGSTHHKLADVITDLMAGEHVMMVGPAGTGKSTIAEQAAEALELESYSISLSPQTPASQLLGYMQATGEYVTSLFRKAYETGGVFHFDEVDNAHPSVLAVINSALANGRMAFPDQMVARHKDFRAVASANTYGRGADRAYVGRSAIDAATLDRFTIETIEIDESLETALCKSVGLETDQVDRVLRYVRKIRAKVAEQKMPIVVSPRASMGMVRLLKAGRSWESAVEARVRRGMSDAEWRKVSV